MAFLSAVAASFLALIPVLSPWILMVPHSVYLYLVHEVPMPFCLLYLCCYYLVSTNSFTTIYDRHLHVHPYVIGLSVFLGYLTMAAQGIIYAPLIVSLIHLLHCLTSEKMSRALGRLICNNSL